jgi:hypothetical protein
VHFSPPAVEITTALPKLGDSRFVFTTNGRPPDSGFSRAKAALDRRIGELSGTEVEPWILHDLGRTAATGMALLNIAPQCSTRY